MSGWLEKKGRSNDGRKEERTKGRAERKERKEGHMEERSGLCV
jgi:hypothetical protein